MDSSQAREALNKHGAFFKKAVLGDLLMIGANLQIFEEFGTSFGGVRVADIVATYETEQAKAFLVIECKRTRPEKSWLFFPHHDQRHRTWRGINGENGESCFFRDREHRRVCSEGYEYPIKGDSSRADQDPIFKAASQLIAAYLGLVDRRELESRARFYERFIPILVTTAPLYIIRNKWTDAPLSTGHLTADLDKEEVTHLVLKHPFPTPEGLRADFRKNVSEDPWEQVYTESVYVVRADSLRAFLDLATLESIVDPTPII